MLKIAQADIGLKDRFICEIGKEGNPDAVDHVDGSFIVGSGSDAVTGRC